jgi:hypothetical protein
MSEIPLLPEWIVDQDCRDVWDSEEFNRYKKEFLGEMTYTNHASQIVFLIDMYKQSEIERDRIKYMLFSFALLMEQHTLFQNYNFKREVRNKLKEFKCMDTKLNIKDTIDQISRKLNRQLSLIS